MGWPLIVAAGIAALTQIGGIASEAGARRKDRRLQEDEMESRERIAMEQLGFKKEEMKLLEKQRGFNRLKDLMSAGSQLQDKTRGWQRLSNLRMAR